MEKTTNLRWCKEAKMRLDLALSAKYMASYQLSLPWLLEQLLQLKLFQDGMMQLCNLVCKVLHSALFLSRVWCNVRSFVAVTWPERFQQIISSYLSSQHVRPSSYQLFVLDTQAVWYYKQQEQLPVLQLPWQLMLAWQRLISQYAEAFVWFSAWLCSHSSWAWCSSRSQSGGIHLCLLYLSYSMDFSWSMIHKWLQEVANMNSALMTTLLEPWSSTST